MEITDVPSETVLKEVLQELEEPVVFHEMLKDANGLYIWKLLEWNLTDLSEKFGNKLLPFRVGYNAKSMVPQWELQCATKHMTLKEFLQLLENSKDNHLWYYFDYKYMHEWFKDNPDILSSLNWQRFGVDKEGPDSTLWIGSKGAHTVCHQDTYGCNLIAQIYGRKQWLLFPPSCSSILRPSRVPYEESTVYSKINFFSPTEEDEKLILSLSEKLRLIELEPGDVLFVPKGWWHYVESMNLSISVNIWLPIDSDDQSRFKEALVKLISMTIDRSQCAISNLSYCLELVECCLKELEKKKSTSVNPFLDEKKESVPCTVTDLCARYPKHVKRLDNFENCKLKEFFQEKMQRFSSTITQLGGIEKLIPLNDTSSLSIDNQRILQSVINAFCHPDVITQVAKQFVNNHSVNL